MAIITISRQFGAGGRTLARMIAKKLNYLYLDEIIIEEIAKKAQVSKNSVKSMERTVGGKLSKFFSIMLNEDYMNRLLGENKGYIDEEVYFRMLPEIITELSEQGNVVIMGRGSQYILDDREDVIHIYLVSDMEHRIKFMQRFYHVDETKAKRLVIQGEKMRTTFYSKFGKTDYDNPLLYHLVINRSKLTIDETIELVSQYVNIRKKAINSEL